MPKTKTPTLSAVAAEQDDEKKKAKGASLLAKALGLLGIGAADAKMTKKTLTTKRVEMEESDESEEEESMPMSTEKSSGAASSEASSAAEEEEESGPPASEEEEEEKAAKGKGAKYEEEEEERAVAKGWQAAIAAYAKATKGVDAYGVKGPKGLLRAAEKATGTKGAAATLSALHGLRTKAATADAAVIQRLAKVEAKATKIEVTNRADRVNAMVQAAKASGHAPTKALRAQLREYGKANGTKALANLIASLPKVARTTEDGERIPHIDGKGSPIGAPNAQEQITQMAQADLSPEAKAQYEKIRAEVAGRKANGAAKVGGY